MKNNSEGNQKQPKLARTVVFISLFLISVLAVFVCLHHHADVFVPVSSGNVAQVLEAEGNGLFLFTDPYCESCAECKQILNTVCKDEKVQCGIIDVSDLTEEDQETLNRYEIFKTPSLILVQNHKVQIIKDNLNEDIIRSTVSGISGNH